ncbi:hypothetical protein VISI1226_08534 [Vibrio sinaloensis DSM 21326]|uniref:DUF6817 domain-containing protein n=1 Tax=Vibrio sinaloensis DSM 21326 TaxID=945550 RepID=E8MDH4_PHOS4|nr:hypothetical protein [Vibrio sinaloensis]EGA67960.1 hypothetical protein VISI1226_08534 [Vibrio sinaloensis DSM 21326]
MDKFAALKALGAGDFQHLNGSLEAHLQGTQALLNRWGADEVLQVAGLFHAAYGTAGFDDNMVSLAQRDKIASIIGPQAEALVYLYCSCDRDFVFPQFGLGKPIQFKDRFVEREFELSAELTVAFCELTVANELELVLASDVFKQQYGEELKQLFDDMREHLSPQAKQAYSDALCDLA